MNNRISLKAEEMRRINSTKFFFHDCFSVECETTTRSQRGGLCMLWRDSIMLHLVSYSLHHIVGTIVGSEGEQNWTCSGVYGWPETDNRTKTWNLLEYLRQTVQGAWLCIGDFNEILWSVEKRGGNPKSFYLWDFLERHWINVS